MSRRQKTNADVLLVWAQTRTLSAPSRRIVEYNSMRDRSNCHQGAVECEPLVPLIASATSPYFIVGDGFPQPLPQPAVGELEGNKCIECHRAQCIPDFFNVPLEELAMPAPFYEIHYDTKMASDRALLNEWCESLEIEYFSGK